MDADTAASRGQETTHESDSVLEDIGLLFKDSMDKPTIRCWNEAEICEIIHDNHETVELVSFGAWPIPDTATFNRRLLTRLSPFFKALLEGGFSESTEKVLTFESWWYELRFFEEWVSTGNITFDKWVSTGDITIDNTSLFLRIELYLYADYYDIPALRRKAMSILVEHKVKPCDCLTIGRYIEWVPSSSPLYRFFVEAYTQHEVHCVRWKGYEEVSKEILYDTFFSLANRSADKPCRCCHNHCDFHDHDSEEEWEKTCHVTNPEFLKPDPSTYRKLPMGRQRGMKKSV